MNDTYTKNLEDKTDSQEHQIEQLEKKLDAYKKVLEFYGDRDNWINNEGVGGFYSKLNKMSDGFDFAEEVLNDEW